MSRPLASKTDSNVTAREPAVEQSLSQDWPSGSRSYINDVDEDSSNSALHRAARQGSLESVEFLVKAGENLSQCNQKGQTPLMLAAEGGHRRIVEYLLSSFDKAFEEAGKEAIAAQEASKEPKAAQEENKEPEAADNAQADLVSEKRFAKAAYLNMQNAEGWTALHRAAWYNHPDVVTFLIANGADVRCRGGKLERTPLHLAAAMGRTALVSALLDAVAEAERPGFVNLGNVDGNTALHRAALWGHTETVKLLVAAGGDLMLANHKGQTPLDLAQTRGHREATFSLD